MSGLGLFEDFDDRIGTGVEELIRWATPVMTFRRTAATDFELSGQNYHSAGEKVVMFYSLRQLGRPRRSTIRSG